MMKREFTDRVIVITGA